VNEVTVAIFESSSSENSDLGPKVTKFNFSLFQLVPARFVQIGRVVMM
jgi:hypothetical protein